MCCEQGTHSSKGPFCHGRERLENRQLLFAVTLALNEALRRPWVQNHVVVSGVQEAFILRLEAFNQEIK